MGEWKEEGSRLTAPAPILNEHVQNRALRLCDAFNVSKMLLTLQVSVASHHTQEAHKERKPVPCS